MTDTKARKQINLTIVLLLAFAGLLVGIFVSQHIHRKKVIDPNQFHGALLSNPRQINAFEFVGVDNKPFNNDSLKGQWTMVFFGFTNCGYLCPTSMAELGKMYRLLEQQKLKTLPRVVMISIDPDRDSLQKLGTYVKAFDQHFYGARESMDKVGAMTKELGIVHMKVKNKKLPEDSKNYDIQHSGAVMLFNPQGQLSAFFSAPHNAKNLAEDFTLLVS